MFSRLVHAPFCCVTEPPVLLLENLSFPPLLKKYLAWSVVEKVTVTVHCDCVDQDPVLVTVVPADTVDCPVPILNLSNVAWSIIEL